VDEHAYIVNVEAAVAREGEYLVVERAADEEHAAGRLAFPGGKVEQSPGSGDTIEETARREVAEETGVEVADVAYVRSRTVAIDPDTPVLNIVTRCEYESGQAVAREPAEVAAVNWLSAGEIRSHPDAPPYLESDVDALEAGRGISGDC
jgi:8-oxo-dGTP diphosphatase